MRWGTVERGGEGGGGGGFFRFACNHKPGSLCALFNIDISSINRCSDSIETSFVLEKSWWEHFDPWKHATTLWPSLPPALFTSIFPGLL